MKDYISFYIKSYNRDFKLLQDRYKSVVSWLAISAIMNAALLGAWLWERVQ